MIEGDEQRRFQDTRYEGLRQTAGVSRQRGHDDGDAFPGEGVAENQDREIPRPVSQKHAERGHHRAGQAHEHPLQGRADRLSVPDEYPPAGTHSPAVDAEECSR